MLFSIFIALLTIIYIVYFNRILVVKRRSTQENHALDYSGANIDDEKETRYHLTLRFIITLILLCAALYIVFFPSSNFSSEAEKLASGIIGAIMSSWISKSN